MIRHILLLIASIVTTTIVGAQFLSQNPFVSWSTFSSGFYYSFALLTILFCHEMGHYLYARRYGINVTLPFFIPIYIPFVLTPGTLGAFIRLKSPIPNKLALFDVGIAGPLAGFVVSIAFILIGLDNLPAEEQMWKFIETLHPVEPPDGTALTMGNILLFDFLTNLMGISYLPMYEIYHFPYIFAGWFGLLVTAINLMPIGQLDGGHITYALFGPKAGRIALIAFGGLILLNIYLITNFNSFVYLLWTLLILVFIRFRHPPTLNDDLEIGKPRFILGILSYLIFILCFSPMPFYFS